MATARSGAVPGRACYTNRVAAATRSPDNERLRRILERAARVICQQGFEATSMQEIAVACGLTKAGLYHHIKTKDALLLAIMSYGGSATVMTMASLGLLLNVKRRRLSFF